MSDSHRLKSIIDGCKREEPNAQHDLYREFYSYGMSISIRYVNNESEAISIVNDSFMKVYKGLNRFDSKHEFKYWFRTLLINTAIDHLRKQKKFKREILMETPKELSVSETIISKLGHDEIMRLVQSLSVMYRTVFNMYVIDGYKHEEISNILGISINTSKSNLSRAKANLRNLLTEKIETKHA